MPCGHFWRHLLVPKGGKSAPRRKHPIRGTELSQRKRESISLFFCAFGLIQKHQKIKHGEKQRVTTPALTERAQKTPLLRRKGLRRFDCGGSAKSASGLCVRLLNVVLHTHSWRSPGAVTSSATFAVRSGRPETCHVRTQTNDYHCAQRTTVSALHRRRKRIGQRRERPERSCENGAYLA